MNKVVVGILAVGFIVVFIMLLSHPKKAQPDKPVSSSRIPRQNGVGITNTDQIVVDMNTYKWGTCDGSIGSDSPQVQCVLAVDAGYWNAFDPEVIGGGDMDTNMERWCCCDSAIQPGLDDNGNPVPNSLRGYCG